MGKKWHAVYSSKIQSAGSGSKLKISDTISQITWQHDTKNNTFKKTSNKIIYNKKVYKLCFAFVFHLMCQCRCAGAGSAAANLFGIIPTSFTQPEIYIFWEFSLKNICKFSQVGWLASLNISAHIFLGLASDFKLDLDVNVVIH